MQKGEHFDIFECAGIIYLW